MEQGSCRASLAGILSWVVFAMRFWIVLMVTALFCTPALAQTAELTVYPSDGPKIQYATQIKLYSGERLTQESEISFLHGLPAYILTGMHSRREQGGAPGMDVYERIGSLIIAGSADCGFSQPEHMSDWLWDGVWQHAQHLRIGELEFYVYSPGSDRIVISVDRIEHSLLLSRDQDQVELEAKEDWSFYGSLEMPYHCNEIGKPLYMFELAGYREAEIVREHQIIIFASAGISASVLCKPLDIDWSGGPGVASCLLLVVANDATGAELDEHLFNALDGFEIPTFDTITLGSFAFHYYFPKSDVLEFTLWELAGKFSADWHANSKLVGRTRLANNQPEPPRL